MYYVYRISFTIRHRASGHGVGVPPSPLPKPLSLSPSSWGVFQGPGPKLPGPAAFSHRSVASSRAIYFGPKRALTTDLESPE
eukprot:9249358-Pyramimonas_sp.AAC.2